MKTKIPKTQDEIDMTILDLANEKDKFALQIGATLSSQESMAFERGIDNDWFMLIDVSPIAAHPGVFRVFKLTQAGKNRRTAILNQH